MNAETLRVLGCHHALKEGHHNTMSAVYRTKQEADPDVVRVKIPAKFLLAGPVGDFTIPSDFPVIVLPARGRAPKQRVTTFRAPMPGTSAQNHGFCAYYPLKAQNRRGR